MPPTRLGSSAQLQEPSASTLNSVHMHDNPSLAAQDACLASLGHRRRYTRETMVASATSDRPCIRSSTDLWQVAQTFEGQSIVVARPRPEFIQAAKDGNLNPASFGQLA